MNYRFHRFAQIMKRGKRVHSIFPIDLIESVVFVEADEEVTEEEA